MHLAKLFSDFHSPNKLFSFSWTVYDFYTSVLLKQKGLWVKLILGWKVNSSVSLWTVYFGYALINIAECFSVWAQRDQGGQGDQGGQPSTHSAQRRIVKVGSLHNSLIVD